MLPVSVGVLVCYPCLSECLSVTCVCWSISLLHVSIGVLVCYLCMLPVSVGVLVCYMCLLEY